MFTSVVYYRRIPCIALAYTGQFRGFVRNEIVQFSCLSIPRDLSRPFHQSRAPCSTAGTQPCCNGSPTAASPPSPQTTWPSKSSANPSPPTTRAAACPSMNTASSNSASTSASSGISPPSPTGSTTTTAPASSSPPHPSASPAPWVRR